MSHAVIKKKWVQSGKQSIWNGTLDNKGFKKNIDYWDLYCYSEIADLLLHAHI